MLSADLYVASIFTLTFGVPMVLAYRELRRVQRSRRRGGDGNVEPDRRVPPLPDGDHTLPPLPPSLVDAAKGRPVRSKVLEPV